MSKMISSNIINLSYNFIYYNLSFMLIIIYRIKINHNKNYKLFLIFGIPWYIKIFYFWFPKQFPPLKNFHFLFHKKFPLFFSLNLNTPPPKHASTICTFPPSTKQRCRLRSLLYVDQINKLEKPGIK